MRVADRQFRRSAHGGESAILTSDRHLLNATIGHSPIHVWDLQGIAYVPLLMHVIIKRIQKEISDVAKEEVGGIKLSPTDNLFNWKGVIPGPDGSVYEGGVFHVDIALAPDYPFAAPKVKFVTRIYHMNIAPTGAICIDILKNNWSPALSLTKVMLSLSSLLTDPNPNDPLVPTIATQYIRNRQQHDRQARHWTSLYAQPAPTSVTVPKPPVVQATNNTSGTSVRVPPGPSILYLDGTGPQASSSSNPRRTRRPAAPVSRTQPETLEILDSDDEGQTRRPKQPSSRKHGRDEGSDSDIEISSTGPSNRHRPKKTRSGNEGTSSDDVIVIED